MNAVPSAAPAAESMMRQPVRRPRANEPSSLRDRIEEAAMACQLIGLTLALLSRDQEIHGDFAGALAALERLCLHTADDIDAIAAHLPAPGGGDEGRATA